MKNILFLFIVTLLFSSCFDNFLNQEPETKVTASNYWKTEKDVESAIYGMHFVFRESFGNVTTRLYRERALPFDYLSVTWRYITLNQLRRSYSLNSASLSWDKEYKAIASCNLILDNLHRAEMPQERRDFYEGQALTLRAWCYFYIIRTWGDAPYISSSEDVGEKRREDWKVIAERLVADLKRATNLLPSVKNLRDESGTLISSRQIPSCGTSWALLAHVYAWLGQFGEKSEYLPEAIKACDKVINSGDYELASTIKRVCDVVMAGNSEEGILELDFRNYPDEENAKGACWAGACQKWPIEKLATPATKRSLVRISNAAAMSLYPDLKDQRRTEYFYKLDSMAKVSTTITQGGAYIQKFRQPLYNASGSQVGQLRAYENNEILLRLADIILLRAELRALTNDHPGAISDLNVIRRRAGAPEYSSDEDLWLAIANERDKELFLEGISRQYFDAVRTGNLQRLQGDFQTLTKQDIQQGALFLPVSNGFFMNNTLAWQYPYWTQNGFRL